MFSIIGGVVVETGGVVAHAVMISREYGLPCMANLTRACERIPDGALVTVDGTTGRVMIHEPGSEAGPQRRAGAAIGATTPVVPDVSSASTGSVERS